VTPSSGTAVVSPVVSPVVAVVVTVDVVVVVDVVVDAVDADAVDVVMTRRDGLLAPSSVAW